MQQPDDAAAGHVNPIKIPKPGDNDAMRLWRATVSPIDNIGEPYSAHWWGWEDRPPPTAYNEINNSPPPELWIRLEYDIRNHENPAIGFWKIDSLVEEVFVPSNSGVHEELFPVLFVAHGPVLPCHAPFYQISNARDPIPLGILDDALVALLARETAMKGKDYVKHFVKRYIKTIHPFNATFTRQVDTRLKNNVVKLLIEAGRKPYGEREAYALDKWYERIRPQIEDEEEEEEEDEERRFRYNMLALDIDMLENDIAHEIFFNSKGRIAVPGNKMAAHYFKNYYIHEQNYEHARNTHFPHLKPKPVEPGKKHSQRRREKKIMERRLEEMRQQMRRQGEDPAAIIDDEPQDAPDSKRAQQIAEARNRALEWLRNISRPSNGGNRRGKFTKKRSKI